MRRGLGRREGSGGRRFGRGLGGVWRERARQRSREAVTGERKRGGDWIMGRSINERDRVTAYTYMIRIHGVLFC